MRLLSVPTGVVLDPFSILFSGILRKHGKSVSDKRLEILHGEARFKQAFVNACCFAESMTVIGPVAQFIQDKQVPPLDAALRWRAALSRGFNDEFFETLRRFMGDHNLDKVPLENVFPSGLDSLLHLMPDVTLQMKESSWTRGPNDVRFDVFSQLFQEKWRTYSSHPHWGRPNKGKVLRGEPVAAFMAVIFTFKKPVGPLAVGELTNLASWPPVVFLLPVLVPAFGTIDPERERYGSAYSIAVDNRPSIMSYRIRIPSEDERHRTRTLPYAQPFLLKSIDSCGKEPDVLRSLSDVFKALWSQAAQYSAWNLQVEWDQTGPNRMTQGELALDPIGAGRRIRGHNRFSGKFSLEAFSMLWEEDPFSVDGKTWGWDSSKDTAIVATNRTKLFLRQLRSFHLNGNREFLFVFPSYFQDQISQDFLPTALTLARWMTVGHSGLEDFVDSNVVSHSLPGDGSATPDMLADPANANLLPSNAGLSFVDRLATKLGQDDEQPVGALPVRRVVTPIGFNKTGDPQVFGLVVDNAAQDAMREHLLTPGATAALSDAAMDRLVDGTQVQENFKFLDAFCSKSTKDLTDVFATVNKKKVEKMQKNKGYVDESMVVDLFDDMLD